jgi:four helix bundle protein
MSNKKYDLEDRLVLFAANSARFCNDVFGTPAGDYYAHQLLQSAGSSALNFGEAQGSSTIKDYCHKASISLKELKESRVNLKILFALSLGNQEKSAVLRNECEQLIAIISTIIKNKSKSQN